MTFRITFPNVCFLYAMYSACILGIFFAKNLLRINSFSGAEILLETPQILEQNLLKMSSFSVLEIC